MVCVCVLGVWLGAGARVPAQPAPGTALSEVVTATLAVNPEIQLAARQAEALHGALQVVGAPFDVTFSSTGRASRLHTGDPTSGAEAVQKNLSYQIALQRLFRNGLSLTPDVTLRRTSFSTRPGERAANDASVGLTATLPLLRDRAGALSVAPEKAAALDYEAGLSDWRHTTALRVLASASAYWDYLSAQRRLQALQAAEERAARTAEQTRVLVEADERTAADLTQILGNLASKRVARLAAEQALVEARQALGLAVGWPAERMAVLAPPMTPFPEPAPEGPAPDEAALLRAAVERRDDLAAAERDLRAAQVLLDSSRSELRPRLDLTLFTGYNASEAGLGLGQFFAPLYKRGPKWDASLALSYQWPFANSRARGRLEQNASTFERQRVLSDDLRRRVESGVTVAVEGLRRAAQGLSEAARAVELTESTVQAEQRKFELGVTTLFDVIQAEDALTSALLSQIQTQRTYAVAIATLRFQSGTLLEPDGERRVLTEHLLTPP